VRDWLARRAEAKAKRRAMRDYPLCAHCIALPPSRVLPRHHSSVGDDPRDPDSWLPLCSRCRSSIEHERKQLLPAGFGV
jgi:hypothetical protein